MKHIILLLALILGTSLNAQAQKKDLNNLPVLREGQKAVINEQVVPVAESPALLFESTNIDFGSVKEGEKVEIVYKATNQSDQVVKIENLKTGCGCTQAGKNPTEIKPGETVEIKVNYNTHGRRGNSQRSMVLETNDPAQPKYNLKFKGKAWADLYWSNTYVNFRNIDYGKEHTRKVSLFSALDDFAVEKITCSDPRITASVVEEKPFENKELKGTEYILEIKIGEDFPVKSFQERLTLVHKSSSKTNLPTITVAGVVEGDVTINPKRIYGRVVEDQPTSTTVTLTSRSKSSFEIKDVLNPKNLPLEVEVIDTNNPYEKKLIAHMHPEKGARTRQGNIELKLVSSKDNKEVSVTVPAIIAVHRRRVIPPSFRNNAQKEQSETDSRVERVLKPKPGGNGGRQ